MHIIEAAFDWSVNHLHLFAPSGSLPLSSGNRYWQVGEFHRLSGQEFNGHEFEETPGVGDRQGGQECCSPWGRKEADTTERLD